MNIKKFLIGTAAGALMFGATVIPAFASTSIVYDALPSVSPITNYPSQAFQAQQTAEFGDYIHLGGTERALNMVTVTMSDWALYSDYASDIRYSGNSESWTHPITLNVYTNHLDVNGVPDQKIATVTQDIVIPWRPIPDGCDSTGWTDSAGNCDHGLAFNAVFDLSSLNVALPDDIIVSVAFNTQTWGYDPIGTAGPYNSLNVAIPNNQPVAVGTDDSVDKVFWNSTTQTGGIFIEDSGWTPNGTVALQVTVNVPDVVPTDMSQCKKDGWKTFNNPSFKNQGQCVSYVVSNNHTGNKPN